MRDFFPNASNIETVKVISSGKCTVRFIFKEAPDAEKFSAVSIRGTSRKKCADVIRKFRKAVSYVRAHPQEDDYEKYSYRYFAKNYAFIRVLCDDPHHEDTFHYKYWDFPYKLAGFYQVMWKKVRSKILVVHSKEV